MSEPTNQPIARHGTNILQLVTQVTDDLKRGDCVARTTDQQLVAIRKGGNTVIKQCQEMEGRLTSIEEEKKKEEETLQRQIGSTEASMQKVKATVRHLEEKRSRDKAVLQDHERDLNNAKNRLDEARKSKDRAVSGTVAAGVGTVILGAIFPPSLAVTVPATAAVGTTAILNAQSDIDRINGNIGRIRSDISSTEREISSRNGEIRQHEADISRLRSSCCELERKRGSLRKNISFVLQAKIYFTELINATEMGGQRTTLLQSIIAKFHARQDISISTSRGVHTVAKSFYEAWKSFEEQVLSGEEYLSIQFSDVQ